MIIDGKSIAFGLRNQIKTQALSLHKRVGRMPGLAVILIGDDYASGIYVRNKLKACEEVCIQSTIINLASTVTEAEVLEQIAKLNADDAIDGILVQLPVPEHISVKNVVSAISPEKDVDGFGINSTGKLCLGQDALYSCTPEGCLLMIKSTGVPLSGKHAVVVGRSNEVGKPMALLLLRENCTITICHSKTQNLAKFTKQADILVVAVGKPHIIKANMIKKGAVVIDVGINRVEGKLVGDVDFDNAKKIAGHISPVPGGVGPMTIAMLMINTLKAMKTRNGID